MVKETDTHSRLTTKLVGLFIACLFLTSLAERGINAFVNAFLVPTVAHHVFPDSPLIHLPISSAAVIILALAALMILYAVEFVLPIASPITGRCSQFLAYVINDRIEGSAVNLSLQQISPYTALLLFLLFLGILALYLLPYLTAAILYTRFVVRETNRIRKREEETHRRYEESRNLMLSDIAHDLRNPITTVSGYAKALSDGMITDPEQQKQYLQAIEKKSLRVNDLINLLFEYSKLNSSNFKLNTEQLDLNELVRENTAIMYDEIEAKGLVLEANIPDEPMIVSGDRIQLSRLVTNLITNAVRHNPAGTKILVESVAAADEQIPTYSQIKSGSVAQRPILDRNCGHVIIADTGPEIPESVREHIFEPFITGDASRSGKGGSGLGLSIAAKVAQMHGWHLDLIDAYHGYTKAFVIRIPTV